MPEKIINLDARRNKREQEDTVVIFERMAMIEDVLEVMDELNVSTRDELVTLLETLENSAPESPE
ncbi:MAG: hypothetical protein M9934_10525 [Thermomicrobiales bacterium]|nr:hypothetical protein [Thermomicrobiales bacterium]MCO5228701.1 hypothetical protein [Thermomicrobiales bacterium]